MKAGRLVILLGLAGFLAAGFLLDRLPYFAKAKGRLQCPYVPTSQLNYGAVGRTLRTLRMVIPVPNDKGYYPNLSPHRPGLQETVFQKKRTVGSYLYMANRGWAAECRGMDLPPPPPLPASAFKKGWPIVSVSMWPEDLDSPRWGIRANKSAHGKEWERPCQVDYYQDGQVLLSARAGIRLHGGMSRDTPQFHSFRLYFRGCYGPEYVDGRLIFGGQAGPMRRLVIHSVWPEHAPFNACLAFDVARQMGCQTPEATPVLFYLNGENRGPHFIVEHVGRTQWLTHIKHKNFLFALFKGAMDAQSREAYKGLHRFVRGFSTPMTMAQAAELVNVENLSSVILATVFCGLSDAEQGAAIQDQERVPPQWSWINWDMDHSFWDPYNTAPGKPWEQPDWDRVFCPKSDQRRYKNWVTWFMVRPLLFSRLVEDAPEYRIYFARRSLEILNHKVNARFLNARLESYAQLAQSYAMTNNGYVDEYRKFFDQRAAHIVRRMPEYVPVPPIHTCTITGPNDLALVVDGYPEETGYRGWYLEGDWIRVEKPAVASFGHWRVNGERMANQELKLEITRPLQIEAVCTPDEKGVSPSI